MRSTHLMPLMLVLICSTAVQAAPFFPPTQPGATGPAFERPQLGERMFGPMRSMVERKPLNITGKLRSVVPMTSGNAANVSQAAGAPSPQLLVSLGQMAERAEKFEEARTHYQQAVKAAPTDVVTLRAAAHFEDRQHNFGAAEHLYKRSIAASGSSPATLNDLALCTARQKRFSEAQSLFEQAIAKNPTKALYRNNLATLFVEMGQESSALDQLVTVHQPAAAHYNLAMLLQRSGRNDLAQPHFATAESLDPSFRGAQVAMVPPETPLADPRQPSRSVLVTPSTSEPWTPPTTAAPAATPTPATPQPATSAWSPAPAADITPIRADSAANDANGPQLLPPVR